MEVGYQAESNLLDGWVPDYGNLVVQYLSIRGSMLGNWYVGIVLKRGCLVGNWYQRLDI